MSSEDLVEAMVDHQKRKNLIRSQYKDVMIKIDGDIYYLDRLHLALKSGYFEKLFTEDYSDKNCDLIEIPLMDTDTFSDVVDIIYGHHLKAVISVNNYVSLLMAMDYLQMNIDVDQKTYEHIVHLQLSSNSPPENNVFQLYHFIAENANYKYLLPVVFEHLSKQLSEIQDLDEFLSIPIDHFIEIILDRGYYSSNKENIIKICTKWICHDMENRLPHIIDVINAAKRRFYLSNRIPCDLKVQLSAINEHVDQDKVSDYFWELLMYDGEIACRDDADISKSDSEDENEKEVRQYTRRSRCSSCEHDYDRSRPPYFEFNDKPKLETFLRNSYFYDITVKAGEKLYKLHRSVLKSESSYFEDIFSTEYSEVIAQCEGIPTLPSKDTVYFIDNIDSSIFDIIIDYIYLKKEQFTSDIIVRLFQASHILKIENLLAACRYWMKSHSEDLSAKDVTEILNFTHDKTGYQCEKLSRFFLSKYIVDSWPEIENLPQFADLFKAIVPLEETDDSDANKVYLFDKVDQETFKLITDYIYIGDVKLSDDNIVRVLKASEVFKIENLMTKCVDWLVEWPKLLSPEDVFEVLSFASRNTRYKILHRVYLVKYIMKWPQIDISLFCWISFDSLWYILMSRELHFDDPRKILDICSRWIIQDTENRYRLLPRIALAISRNRMVGYDEYSVASPSDFNHCSQDFVKDKLWEVLSSTSILPADVLLKITEKKTKAELPVFISSEKGRKFNILNDDWNEIASFCLCQDVGKVLSMFYFTKYAMSATMINDNLFILCTISLKTYFHVYNFSSKRLFSLASDPRIDKKRENYICWYVSYTLLSCCNEIYCCLEDGEVLKYSFELNRWMEFSESEPDKYGMRFASDGNVLYRMYKISETDTTTSFIMEVYDFGQNSWVSSPNLPTLTCSHAEYESNKKYKMLSKLIFMKDYGFAALFESCKLFLFDQQAQRWRNMSSMPYNYVDVIEQHSIISQDAVNEMLYVSNNKLYSFSRSNRDWELKKEWPLLESRRSLLGPKKYLPYGNIIAIHNPAIRS